MPHLRSGAVSAATARRVSAQAAQESRALVWEAETIARFMAQHPEIALRGLRLMAERVEGGWDRLQDLATGRVERRVARALLRLAHLTGRTTDAESAVAVEVREQDLAKLVGSTALHREPNSVWLETLRLRRHQTGAHRHS
jgi:CRP/FNR family transcriptional regulator, nitrogen oxide reductase regulator